MIMQWHEFVFSKKPFQRLLRHSVFWAAWCIAYLLLFHYPIHSFIGWGFHEADDPSTYKYIRQIGLPLFVLKTLIFNSLLAVVVPQTIFTCVLIYWVLPNYFFKKRNVFVISFILIALFVSYYFTAILFKYFALLGNYIFGFPSYYNGFAALMYLVLREQLSSLPVIAGFAVMIKLIK